MNSCHNVWSKCGFEKLPTLLCHSKLWPQQSLSCGRAESNDYLGLYQSNLCLKPRPASGDLLRVGLFMNPALSPWFPFEMFDNICDISLGAINTSFFKCCIEQFSSRAYKWFTREILFVTRLFANKKNLRTTAAFAKNSLCASLPKIAGFAISSSFFKRWKCKLFRN